MGQVKAVCTVPAYFNMIPKDKLLKTQVKLLALMLKELLTDPQLLALAYGLDENLNEKKVVVYDLGGGMMSLIMK